MDVAAETPPRLNLTRGNKKIHPSIGVWNLPVPSTCPGAGACMLTCYATKVTKGLNGVVVAADAENYEASRRQDFAERMTEAIRKMKVPAVRIHSNGDFYSDAYVKKWAEVATALPQVCFFAYTKSLHLDLAPLQALPNFTLIKSFGGIHDGKIDTSKDNYARIVEDETQAAENEYVCPADRPGVKLTGRKEDCWCGHKCDYCLPNGKNKHQVRVAFIEKTNGFNGLPNGALNRLEALDKNRLLIPATATQQARLEALRQRISDQRNLPALNAVVKLFPEMSEEEYRALKEDIKKHGLTVPLEKYEGQVIDGKNRLRACRELGIPPKFVEWNGKGSLVEHVVTMNLKRRHLTEGQRAAIAKEILPMLEREAKERQLSVLKKGSKPPDVEKIPQRERGRARDQAAKIVGVNAHYVSDFKKIESSRPDLAAEVRAGRTNIVAAKREVLRHQLQNKTPPLPTEKYGVIVADPTFRMSEQSSSTAMTLEELSALPIQDICDDECVLFVWVSATQLASGLELIRRWGFQYRTSAVWDQRKESGGSYFRTRHEHLLLATRGDPKTPHAANRSPSVFVAPRVARNEKPDAAYRLVERMYPNSKKLELFARKRRRGWVAYGSGLERGAPN